MKRAPPTILTQVSFRHFAHPPSARKPFRHGSSLVHGCLGRCFSPAFDAISWATLKSQARSSARRNKFSYRVRMRLPRVQPVKLEARPMAEPDTLFNDSFDPKQSIPLLARPALRPWPAAPRPGSLTETRGSRLASGTCGTASTPSPARTVSTASAAGDPGEPSLDERWA